MKAKNPLRKLTLLKTTIAHLDDEQMTAARGGSCGGWDTDGCVNANSAYPPPTLITCL
ncbi:class I lanthipeptide [Acidobacteriota bacterium]